MDEPSLNFLDEVLGKYKEAKPKVKSDTKKSAKNVDFLFDKTVSKSAIKSEPVFINRKILEALPNVVPLSTIIRMESFDDMIKRANGIFIDNPNLSSVDDIGTPLDSRLGTIDRNRKCATCSQNIIDCPGHYGLITFSVPVLNPTKELIRIVIRVLNSVCGSCGVLKLNEEQLRERGILKTRGETRLIAIEKESRDLETCTGRQNVDDENLKCIKNLVYLPKESADKNAIMYKISKQTNELNLMPSEDVFKILDSISDSDAKLLGFEQHHPRDLMLRGIPVIPICSRPSNLTDGRLSQHDLTKKYSDIIKAQLGVQKAINNNNEIEFRTYYQKLTEEIMALQSMSNDDNNNGIKKKNIKEILKGKTGLIRKNIQSKRVDRSGRAVASTNSSLRTNEIGVPKILARSLANTETVTSENVGRINELLKSGDIIYIHEMNKGTKTRQISVTSENKDNLVIKIGDVVDRDLQTGDFVMYGRNPTLSMYSILGARAVIMEDSYVLSIPYSVTDSFNADFDGDELNIFSMKREKAQEELERVMNVRNHFISNETSKTNIGLKMDSVLGSYFLSQPDTFVHPDEFINYLNLIIPPVNLNEFIKRLKKYKIPIDSGRAILSATFPPNLYFRTKKLNIQNGMLISGTIDNGAIGSGSSRSLIQAILLDNDRDIAMNFVDSLAAVSHKYITGRGHTTSVRDCILSKDIMASIYEEIELTKSYIGNMDEVVDKVEQTLRKATLNAKVNDALTNVGKKLDEVRTDSSNSLAVMITSGSKGKDAYFTEMLGIVGQQKDESEFPKNMEKSRRCLPQFDEDDKDIIAKGFISSNYFHGLSPSDLYFNSLGTRDDVVSRAIKTSKSGSMSRHLAKSFEDVFIGKTGSVLMSGNFIIEDIYGWDGLDAAQTEEVIIDERSIQVPLNIERTIRQINNEFGFQDIDGVWTRQ